MLWHQQQKQMQQQREQDEPCYYAVLSLLSSHDSPIHKTFNYITFRGLTTSTNKLVTALYVMGIMLTLAGPSGIFSILNKTPFEGGDSNASC